FSLTSIPSNDCEMSRYHQEEEEYDEDFVHDGSGQVAYHIPYHVQMQTRETKRKGNGGTRRTQQLVSNRLMHPIMKKQLNEFKTEQSDGAIVEEEGEEEEDVYEEIEEEEDEAYEIVDDQSRQPMFVQNRSDIIDKSVISSSRCLVCGRPYTDQFRLFRWPRDLQVRRKWCDDLRVIYSPSIDSSFLCAFHFSSRDFVCSADFTHIFWSNVAKPRCRNRRYESLGPLPWEKETMPRISSFVPKEGEFVIKFRHSKYKVANSTKKRHPVAIVYSISRPHEHFEFSFNRTSSVDNTKFYSCLHCRKAKTETRDKDNIRTIHLDGDRLLSRGDPLSGHHHGCNPMIVPMGEHERYDEVDERDEREERMEKRGKEEGLISNEFHGRLGGKEGMGDGERIVYVDDPTAFVSVSGAVVEVEASDGMWNTHDNNGVSAHHHNMDDLLLGGPSSSHQWVDYSKMDGMIMKESRWREEDMDEGTSDARRTISHAISKKYRIRRLPYSSSLKCPLCPHRSVSTPTLIDHLQEHESNSPQCIGCAMRLDSSLPPSIRRSRLCPMCKM
ncbi:hypothetical protein PFISCL1PPCAC_10641, partial [Pristionchus fissidentatus]